MPYTIMYIHVNILVVIHGLDLSQGEHKMEKELLQTWWGFKDIQLEIDNLREKNDS